MLYTGHGDTGYTHVIGGPALPKCHTRLEALGAIDEAQAQLGLTRALLAGSCHAESIRRIQDQLSLLMADIATAQPSTTGGQHLMPSHLEQLEADLANWDTLIGGFAGFSTPGNSLASAHLHLARTVIRRAERQVVLLESEGHAISPLLLCYLNRLSSWIYALALHVEQSTIIA